MKKDNKILGIDGKYWDKDEIVRHNFICIDGIWEAGPRLTDEQLKKLKETGKTF